MRNQFVLDNGHEIEAEFINWNYNVDGTRIGAGVVIAKDRMHGDTQLYVTWDVMPSRDDYSRWWAEAGHYGLTWEDAIEDAIKRFNYFKGHKWTP